MANKDVFGRNISDKIFTFTADQMKMTLITDSESGGNEVTLTDTSYADQDRVGFFVTQLQLQYQQAINPVFEIGANRRAFIAGRPSGSGTITHLLGPLALSQSALNKLGDVCNMKNNHLFFYWNADCNDDSDYDVIGNNPSDKLELKYVAATTISLAIDNNNFQLVDTLSIQYAYMVNAKDKANTGAATTAVA